MTRELIKHNRRYTELLLKFMEFEGSKSEVTSWFCSHYKMTKANVLIMCKNLEELYPFLKFREKKGKLKFYDINYRGIISYLLRNMLRANKQYLDKYEESLKKSKYLRFKLKSLFEDLIQYKKINFMILYPKLDDLFRELLLAMNYFSYDLKEPKDIFIKYIEEEEELFYFFELCFRFSNQYKLRDIVLKSVTYETKPDQEKIKKAQIKFTPKATEYFKQYNKNL